MLRLAPSLSEVSSMSVNITAFNRHRREVAKKAAEEAAKARKSKKVEKPKEPERKHEAKAESGGE